MNPDARPWHADVDLPPERAAALLAAACPDLAGASMELLGRGWDNDAYLVDGSWVFRFPRRALGARCMESEIGFLPALAPHLPLPVSATLRVGGPGDGYPYRFAGYPLLPGRTVATTPLDDATLAPVAAPLGRFLAALHRAPVGPDTLAALPGDELRRTDLQRYPALLEERLHRLRTRRPDLPLDAVMESVGRLLHTPPWPDGGVPLHGDLYAAHIVVDGHGRPAGVIDWGDLHRGDPALDLGTAFSLFHGDLRRALLDAYGPVDVDTLARARFRALFYGVVLTDYGLDAGLPDLVRTGERAISCALR